jgi:hypothetical protein
MINIEDEVRQALTDVGNEIIKIWKRQVPVDTGKLKSSLQFRVFGRGNNMGLSFFYRTYGIYVDLGTYGNADRTRFGISPFEYPPFNARPGRGGFGIRPRYWTSLSDPATQEIIVQTLIEKFDESVTERVFDSFGGLRTSTRTRRTTT